MSRDAFALVVGMGVLAGVALCMAAVSAADAAFMAAVIGRLERERAALLYAVAALQDQEVKASKD